MATTDKEGRAPVRKRWKMILGVAASTVALVWLVLFLALGGDFYGTVEEVKAEGPATDVRVGGEVASGSVSQEGSIVTFAVEGESGETMDIVYEGPYPERLLPGEKVVVTGSLQEDGIMAAREVLIKCPDKLLTEKVTDKALTGAGLERLLY